jgi:ABC-type branched-subunit amino acid transport system substrate-binding protein
MPTAFTPNSEVARTRVFISYSHADAKWLKRLQKHLKPLQREGIEVWDDTRLKAGEQWREEIREALAKTRVAVLLISADFVASDFIDTNELPPLLKAAEEDGATILPVIVSASRFLRIESLARFQAVNDPEKPLVQMRHGNQEKVLDDVARAVEDALRR